ncbi:hypothetical protein SCALM49S_00341 [Streptomyces californicus]
MVLAEKTSCAGPSASRIRRAAASSKKPMWTRLPVAPAARAACSAGSTPRWRTPAARTELSMMPSLQPIST